MLKLLHTADWHLGRDFPAFSEEARKKLSRARVDVLDQVFAEAERNAVDAVLCAGDLFDDPNPKRDFWEALASRLQKKRWQRPVFLLPGNHDPLLADGIWRDGTFKSALPPFVKVVDRELEHAFSERAVLYAVPCRSKASQQDPTALIPARTAGDERIRVGLVHGSAFDAGDWQTNFPIAKDAAVERGLDYLALGDTHGFRYVPADRLQPPTLYPGAPEPTAFDEQDAGHVALVFINRQRRALVDKRRVGHWRWETVRAAELGALRALAARDDLKNRVLRLVVEMNLPAPEYEEAEALLDQLAGTEAKHGRAGVLELHREGLRLDVANLGPQLEGLPRVLQAAARTLQLAAGAADTRLAAERALFHLLRTARGS
jgi:DNA repair exonuclease SbcCD nuclease subunit